MERCAPLNVPLERRAAAAFQQAGRLGDAPLAGIPSLGGHNPAHVLRAVGERQAFEDAVRLGVSRQGDGYLMFYIGFRDRDHAQIGVARSKDGIANWQRHPANPIIRPGVGKWDQDAVYKPYAIFDGQKWLLWYNGRRGGVERIGLATHEGEDLGF